MTLSLGTRGPRSSFVVREKKHLFSKFSGMFQYPNIFLIWSLIVLIYYIWETSRNKLKKHSVTENCSDLSQFEDIVLVISKFLQILGIQPRISKDFSQSLAQFFLTVGQNNFGNKIPFLQDAFIFEKKYFI